MAIRVPRRPHPPGFLHAARQSPRPILSSLLEAAAQPQNVVLAELGAGAQGLSGAEAARRLAEIGPNAVAHEPRRSWVGHLLRSIRNPLVILLMVIGVISYLTGNAVAASIIGVMVAMGVLLRFVQEFGADTAVDRLIGMVATRVTAMRDARTEEVPLHDLVPGDVVHLSAGDMVPADVRLLSTKTLFVNQAMLTGESLPVEKYAEAGPEAAHQGPFALPSICFMGTGITSGTAEAVVVATGERTYFGRLAAEVAGTHEATAFEQGVARLSWFMVWLVISMAIIVFLLNGATKGDWGQAFLFGLAVAVGLTPEMLPMIVAACLSNGAVAMSRKKVIVKHLDAIQNFGAIDILCTDKTGTLTKDEVAVAQHLDALGRENIRVLRYAALNSRHQTGLKSALDEAILRHAEADEARPGSAYRKIDEIPFDFHRRRMSVVLGDQDRGGVLLICKGAVEETLAVCDRVDLDGAVVPLDEARRADIQAERLRLNEAGYRVLAIACKEEPTEAHDYTPLDEANLVLVGYVAFRDPPQETASAALAALHDHGVQVKILTGDNELVARKVCDEVGIETGGRLLLGPEIAGLSEDALPAAAERAVLFARLDPMQKERIVLALRRAGHVVGFLGDGVNDSPALRAADVGISVERAADVARESADIVLLDKSLFVLDEGVIEGRRVFSNIVKYIRMGASSNFGNMFSVVGASVFLPFLPMLPVQVLINNLLYDVSQTAIPTDNVDSEDLARPRPWRLGALGRFIFFIGPLSSIFDYTTFFVMLFLFHAWVHPALFRTGWFVESIMTQSLIIHVIRTRRLPFLQSRASWPLLLSTLAAAGVGAWLPASPFAAALGFAPLPPLYWPILGATVLAYMTLVQLVRGRLTGRDD